MVELDGSSTAIRLSDNHWRSMLEDVQRRYPEEACGLLGGRSNKVFAVVPITNALRSGIRYRMEPEEQLRAYQDFDDQGLDIIGIYHSHPVGPIYPSKTDLEEAYYPEAAYLIWSESSGNWKCRAFRITDKEFYELEIHFLTD